MNKEKDNREKIKLIERIMRWHRNLNFDGEYDCLEVYNKNTRVISDVYAFDHKTSDTKVIPMAEAEEERQEEKCYLCQYLRGLKEELKK